MSAWHCDESMFPGISESGRAMLHRLSCSAHAPILRNHSGHRLTADDQLRARAFLSETLSLSPECGSGAPSWLRQYLEQTLPRVPFYRGRGDSSESFSAIQPVSRADFSRDITRFVPDGQDLRRMILFSSSGTTGYPLAVPSHPLVAAGYLAFHIRALGRYGITLSAAQGDVSVMLVGFQKRCFTYASVNPLLHEAGLVKINLNPLEWRNSADRALYIDELAPELISGDPLSLTELATLDFSHRPRALLSTSMALSPALRARLSERFDCPVLDIYSMNESGPIACWSPAQGGHLLLQNRLYVEILSPDGTALPEGERGEITVTGGFNPWLPLIRYRTGDYASLKITAEGPLLVGLEGRAPVTFRAADRRPLNNIDITHALAGLALSQFALHQDADGSLVLHLRNRDRHLGTQAVAELKKLLGSETRIAVQEITADDKIVQYSSDFVSP